MLGHAARGPEKRPKIREGTPVARHPGSPSARSPPGGTRMPKKQRKFVPRMLLAAACSAHVVPLCATEACGGKERQTVGGTGGTGGAYYGVGAQAFGGQFSVGVQAFGGQFSVGVQAFGGAFGMAGGAFGVGVQAFGGTIGYGGSHYSVAGASFGGTGGVHGMAGGAFGNPDSGVDSGKEPADAAPDPRDADPDRHAALNRRANRFGELAGKVPQRRRGEKKRRG